LSYFFFRSGPLTYFYFRGDKRNEMRIDIKGKHMYQFALPLLC
jgi:hypothetical protein